MTFTVTNRLGNRVNEAISKQVWDQIYYLSNGIMDDRVYWQVNDQIAPIRTIINGI